MKLYCYDGEHGTDPHGLVLDVDPSEGLAERPTIVTDINTAKRYRVASADCGQACYCAARAVRVV
jgi:hypothetical protein